MRWRKIFLPLAALLIFSLVVYVSGVNHAAVSPVMLKTSEDLPYTTTRPSEVQVAAVQMHWNVQDYLTTESFRNKIDSLMKQVQAQVGPALPTLVVFPEDVGTPAIFTNSGDALKGVTGLQPAINGMAKKNLAAVLTNRLHFGVGWVRALALSRSEAAGQVYIETFAEMAKKYHMYIIAGSAVLPDFTAHRSTGQLTYGHVGGDVYNISYFFGPDGKILGTQKKVNLIPLEAKDALDIVPGQLEDLKVFDSPFGKIGIAICLDTFKEPVIQELIKEGANVIVQPSANPGPWNKDQQVDWLNSAHLVTQSYPEVQLAINPMMTGPLFDLMFEGQSSITAPAAPGQVQQNYKDLPPTSGFLALAKGNTSEEVLVVKVPRPQ